MLASNNKFYMGQSEALYSLLKNMMSVYKMSNDFSTQNLLYLLKNEGEDLIEAWAYAYFFHCDHSLVKKFLMIAPKIINSMEQEQEKETHLLVLKNFLHLYCKSKQKYLISFKIHTVIDQTTTNKLFFEWDYFEIDTADFSNIQTDPPIPFYLKIPDFSFKYHALSIRCIFRAKRQTEYFHFLTLDDGKKSINIVLSCLNNEKEIELVKNDKQKTLIICLPAHVHPSNWISLRIFLIKLDEIK
jgi:hypothetical protein